MTPILESAIRLRERGLAVHWLQPKSKVPALSGWATAPVMSIEELKTTYRPGYNVGFRPGPRSIVRGKAILVLDVDVRGGPKYAKEAYAAAETLVPELNFHVVSGSGVGRHVYLLCPVALAPPKAATCVRQSDIQVDGKPAWMIELLSDGKNVVLPPSIHPETNRPYEWANPEIFE